MQVSEGVVQDAVLSGRRVPKALLDSVENGVPSDTYPIRQFGRIGFTQGRFVERFPAIACPKFRDHRAIMPRSFPEYKAPRNDNRLRLVLGDVGLQCGSAILFGSLCARPFKLSD